MIPTIDKAHYSRIILLAVISVNLFMLPGKTIDPINSPKLFFLGTFGVCSFVALGYTVMRFKNLMKAPQVSVAVILILQFTVVLFVSGRAEDQFFGVFGRNTGYLALVSLVCIFTLTSLISDNNFMLRLSKALLFCGAIGLLYGLLQVFELDPVAWEPSGYTKIFGFLGNPNFQSAFMGMTASAYIAFALGKEFSFRIKALLLVGFGLSLFVIFKSESEQGFMVILTGLLTVAAIRIFFTRRYILFFSIILSFALIGLVAIIGLLNRGPLASVLYTESISYRGDYWRAAWKMTLDNPVFGVGIDRFGSNYRLYRDQVATLRRGPDVVSNTPHNIFLDYLTSAGFFGFFLFIALNLMSLFAIVRFLKRSQHYSPAFAALTAAWVAYVAQAIISVNQIGLAIWGWVLMGALIGVGRVDNENVIQDSNNKIKKSKSRTQTSSPTTVLIMYLGLGVGSLISIWPLVNDIGYVNALKSGDAQRIEAAAYSRPLDAKQMFDISNILVVNKLEEPSLRVARVAVRAFPETFELWKMLSMTPGATSAELLRARNRMNELDPLNPDLE